MMTDTPSRLRIILASASPRRRQLLEEAGFEVQVQRPHVDDGSLQAPRVDPRWWVMALAYLKARSAEAHLERPNDAIILGADTICVVDTRLLGQPRDAEDARSMLHGLRNRAHRTITGICLFDAKTHARLITVDSAEVRMGELSNETIERYVASGNWRGKAGAYNLRERVEVGWHIECIGDPATVMGLPMRRLPSLLALFADLRTAARTT